MKYRWFLWDGLLETKVVVVEVMVCSMREMDGILKYFFNGICKENYRKFWVFENLYYESHLHSDKICYPNS